MIKQKLDKKIVVLILLASTIIVTFLCIFKNTSSRNTVGKHDPQTVTTSNAPTAQSSFSEGDERDPGNTLNENKGSGGIEDTKGNISGSKENVDMISSASGDISVIYPEKNSVIRSGQVIAGKAKIGFVNYRIMDDISGVISTGKLEVVNGRFSGVIKYTTNAKQGRIDFFGAQENGREFSNIEIPVRFP